MLIDVHLRYLQLFSCPSAWFLPDLLLFYSTGIQRAHWKKPQLIACEGCGMAPYKHLQPFIRYEAKKYQGLEVTFIPNEPPQLVFFDSRGRESERLHIGRMRVEEVRDILADHGLSKSGVQQEEQQRNVIARP
mmetsp:Transcript_43348/g.112770  ORF Transcript_43348/g.112770 Transcript_43348/m.112770 type:complete len:133 (-) Transcript_43348:1895-2293(-)